MVGTIVAAITVVKSSHLTGQLENREASNARPLEQKAATLTLLSHRVVVYRRTTAESYDVNCLSLSQLTNDI